VGGAGRVGGSGRRRHGRSVTHVEAQAGLRGALSCQAPSALAKHAALAAVLVRQPVESNEQITGICPFSHSATCFH
jgi:hypothetical protein